MFIKIGDFVRYKKENNNGLIKNKSYQIVDLKYNKKEKWPIVLLRVENNNVVEVSLVDVKIPKMHFLGQEVEIGQKVKFFIKPIEQLLAENWQKQPKGGLKKPSAYYKFTKDKLSECGKLKTGTIKMNPKFKLCIKDDETDWHFDVSMIRYVLTENINFNPFDLQIGDGYFVGLKNGNLCLENDDGDTVFDFDKNDQMKLLLELLKFNNWIVREPENG